MLRDVDPNRPLRLQFMQKYGHEGDIDVAEAKTLELMRFFDSVLVRQQEHNSRYLVGKSLSAADVFWALASMIVMHPKDDLVAADDINAYEAAFPTAAEFLAAFQTTAAPYQAAITPRLRGHQDHVLRAYCNTPLK